MNIEQGAVYWVTVQDEDDNANIPHPHVVIGTGADTVTVCGITTNMKKVTWPGNLLLKKGEAILKSPALLMSPRF